MTTTASITVDSYQGTPAITMTAGTYQAMVLPEIGGNLVSFQETAKGFDFLRTPKTLEDILKWPTSYGIPLLFPPNRFEDGTFTVNGRTYHFPINEVERNNHLHGFLLNVPWQVEAMDANGDHAFVTLRQKVNEEHPMYEHFPHAFSIEMTYMLSTEGLSHRLLVVNNGMDAMPLMLGLHTTLNVPFAPNSSPEDYTIKLTTGERWEMSDRMLPTGKIHPMASEDRALQDTGIQPFLTALDNHYTASPQDGRNVAKLTNHQLGVELVYDVGLQYTQWMLFNNFARGEFICPEPQTSVVNAPNSKLPASESGLLLLNPGEEWSETSRMYVNFIR